MTEERKVNGEMPTEDDVREALKLVVDPEIHLNIVDLGLVYGFVMDKPSGKVTIKMTLTTPTCPYGPMVIEQSKAIASRLPGVKEVAVDIVWDPPWDPRTMASDEVKFMLGLM